MAQSAETEHGIVREEDSGQVTLTPSSTDAHALRPQHLQAALQG